MSWARQILIFLIRVYQRLLSPLKMAVFGPAGGCRFSPSCSQYAVEALQIHGVLKGGALAARRLCRCHPWGGDGEDPVPPKKSRVHGLDFKVSRETSTVECGGSHTAVAAPGGGK
jgi:putative membrane protein insertion efficiency factor